MMECWVGSNSPSNEVLGYKGGSEVDLAIERGK